MAVKCKRILIIICKTGASSFWSISLLPHFYCCALFVKVFANAQHVIWIRPEAEILASRRKQSESSNDMFVTQRPQSSVWDLHFGEGIWNTWGSNWPTFQPWMMIVRLLLKFCYWRRSLLNDCLGLSLPSFASKLRAATKPTHRVNWTSAAVQK